MIIIIIIAIIIIIIIVIIIIVIIIIINIIISHFNIKLTFSYYWILLSSLIIKVSMYLVKYKRADLLTRNHSSSSDVQGILSASNQAHKCTKLFFLPKTAAHE